MVKNFPANAGDMRDMGLITGLGRSPGGGHGNHSNILAGRIQWAEELAGLQSMESQSWTQLKRLSTHTREYRILAGRRP